MVRRLFPIAFVVSIRIAAAATPADSVYEHGYVYTVDPTQSVQQAVAVSAGRIVYVGNDAGAQAFIGPQTHVEDLHGRMMMPGLIDGHMHPLAGGHSLLGCDMNYERLTQAQFTARIQKCLDESRDQEPNGWLEVKNWFQEAMIGNTVMSKQVLDALNTRRPVVAFSTFGHTALVNSRAIALAHIDAHTPDPKGGQIHRDAKGEPTGLLEDQAMGLVESVFPPSTPAEDLKAAAVAVTAVNTQGITTFLDALAEPADLASFSALQHQGKLTVRAHFAPLIVPAEAAADPHKSVAHAHGLAQKYDQGPLKPAATISVHNIKLFLDGVITAPAMTGNMLQPYFVNKGTEQKPNWVPGATPGPDLYFKPETLKVLLPEAARLGLEPHFHADGDGAVHAALDAAEMLRKQFPPSQLRIAIAHDEIVTPGDFPRYKALDAVPVLSFQWEKQAPDTVDGARDYMGPARYKYMEPAAFLADAGAPIAYGSDWPVDKLDEWFALKVGVTRTNAPEAGAKYAGRLSQDRGLTKAQVLHAITMGAAYELHEESNIGSIETGKLADLIILDRNVMQIPAEDIAHVKVLKTIVGGKTVYEAPAATKQ